MNSSQEEKFLTPMRSSLSTPQYPSMDPNFIPLGFSSPIQNDTEKKFQHNRPVYGNKNSNRNSYGMRNKNYPQKDYRNKKNDDRRNSNKIFERYDDRRDNYFHPSMLEDPWKVLLERHNRSYDESNSSKNLDDSEDDNVDSEDAKKLSET